METGRIVRALATVAVAATVLACTAQRPGAVVGPPTGTAGAAASPTSSPSPDEPGAVVVAAVRDYYAEINRALATGDTTGLAAWMTDDCTCRPLLGYVRDRWRSGRVRGAGYTVRAVALARLTTDVAAVRVDYSVSAIEEYDGRGRLLRTVPPVPAAVAEVELVRGPAGWLVRDVARLPR